MRGLLGIACVLVVAAAAGVAWAYEVTDETDQSRLTDWQRQELAKWSAVAGDPYKRMHSDGYANCIFSDQSFAGRSPSEVHVVQSFQKGQAVWAHCYFPAPLKDVSPDIFNIRLSIDGRQQNAVPEGVSTPGDGSTAIDFNVFTTFPWELDHATSTHPRGAEVTVTIYVKGGELDRSTILHIGPNDVYTTERTVMEAIYLSEGSFRLTGTAPAAPMSDDDKERLKREMMERKGK